MRFHYALRQFRPKDMSRFITSITLKPKIALTKTERALFVQLYAQHSRFKPSSGLNFLPKFVASRKNVSHFYHATFLPLLHDTRGTYHER